MEYRGYNASFGYNVNGVPGEMRHPSYQSVPPQSGPPPPTPPAQPPPPQLHMPNTLPAILGFYNSFEFIDYANAKMKILGRCTHCGRMIAGQWRPERVTSNFITHLKHCSQAVYSEYEKKKEEQKRLGKRCRSDFPEVTSISPTDKTYPRYSPEDYVERVTLSVSRFICLDVQPVSVVEKEGFQQMIQILVPECPILLTKDLVVNRILALRQEVEHRVHQLMNRALYCALQVRLWLSPQNERYLGVCGNYIHDRRVSTVVLVCKRISSGSEGAEQVVNELCEVSAKYHFQDGRITAAIMKDSQIRTQHKEHETTFSSHDSELQQTPRSTFDSSAIDIARIWREMVAASFNIATPEFCCTEYLLELVVKDGLKEASPSIKDALTRCHKTAAIISHLHHPAEFAMSVQDLEGFDWSISNVGQWISLLGTIGRILQEDIKPNGVARNVPNLHEDDKIILKELERLFKPVINAIERLKSEDETTGSLLLPILIGVMRQIQSQQDVRFCSTIQGALLDAWHERFADLLDIERGKIFILAAILDPRMKVKWVCEPNKHARLAAYKSALLEEMQHISAASNNMVTTSPATILPDTVIKLEMPEHQQDDLLSYLTESQDVHDHAPWPLKEELEAYLQDTSVAEPLHFWSDRTCRYPTLQKLHHKFHCVLATVKVLERRLSFASVATLPVCPITSDKLFETILFLKGNPDFLR